MSLTDEIAAFEEEKARTHDRDVLDLIDETTIELVNTGIAERAVGVGDRAPDFALPDARGEMVSLSGLTGLGPVILTFYRGGWCPYCNLELRAYQRELAAITAAGGQLAAVSPLTPDNSLSVEEKNALSFPVLSDAGNRAAAAFGLVFEIDERLKPVYKERLGNDLEACNGDASFTLPLPATYVIGADGVVGYAYVNADYRLRADPADVIAALLAQAAA
ncbi:MAG: peroxiredoxin-like family protein [Magnetovibrio sp.]|nr:peroxiredoxin-like family protein [Magnetovibrio sp.]